MSHELTIRENGTVEFASAVTRGWHKLGQLKEDGLMTCEEAISLAHLDWEVSKIQNEYTFNGQTYLSNSHSIVRMDNGFEVGNMSANYTTIQNRELFEFLDEVVGSGKACWDTAGSLHGGSIVFVNLLLEGNLFLKSNPDDKTQKRILALWSHNGKFAPKFCFSPERVVCQNTLNIALKDTSNEFKIRHRKNYKSKMDEVGKALGLASAFYDDLQTVMDSLAEQEVTSTYATGFIEALIPAEKDPATGKIATRTANTRDTLSDLFANGMGNNGRTKWDLFNAVTEYVDHHQVGRITGSRLEKSNDSLAIIERDARFERSILGAGAVLKQKAMDLLLN